MSIARQITPVTHRPLSRVVALLPGAFALFGWRTALARRAGRRVLGQVTLWRRCLRTAAATISRGRLRSAGEEGMSTAEYAIGTVAACAFAALLYKVITSTQILGLLAGIVSRALHVPF